MIDQTALHGDTPKREFTAFSALSLAFVFISPIVAMYSVFGLGLVEVGPGVWWGWVVTLGGQLLVAVTFGVLSSRWSAAGGVYQWSKNLLGRRYGWFAGWAYIWALLVALTAVSYSGAVFLALLLGLDTTNTGLITALAIALLVLTTIINLVGRLLVRIISIACIGAELVGSIGIGFYLLVFHQVQPITVLGQGLGGAGNGLMMAPFVVAIAFAGWSFLGFESASTISEEVKSPRRAVPRAIVFSLLAVGVTVLFTSLAIILAIPDLKLVASGKVADPVIAVFEAYLPVPVLKVVLALFVIAFISSLMGIHTAVSRVIWALGRDGDLPGARYFGRLRGRQQLPVTAIIATGAVAILLFLPLQNPSIYTLLISFTTAGFYIAFAFPVVGLAIAKVSGVWNPAEPTFGGRAGSVIAWLAVAWIVFETINVMWPRDSGAGWLTNYSSILATGLIGIVGVIAYLTSPATRKQNWNAVEEVHA